MTWRDPPFLAALGMGLVAFAFVLLLGGCAYISGSVVEYEGPVCGEASVKLKVVDNKDRSGFDANVTCGPDGSVQITTTDSSASAVMAAQAEVIRGLAARVGRGP